MPEISIIVPVYNVEKYLGACIESILNQTYKDYELILVDDGSKDNSGKICDDYAEKYPNIYAFHQANQGQGAARNFGVEKSKADWIVFVDSDDVAHPQLLEFLVKAREGTNSLISACLRVQGKEIPEDFYLNHQLLFEKQATDESGLIQLYKSGASFYWALFPSLIHKSIYKKHQMEKGRIYEDNAVCCKWLYEAESLAVIPLQLYFYRTNPQSTMNQEFSLKKLDYLWALEQQMDFFRKVVYYQMLNLIFQEYVGEAVYLCGQMEKHSFSKQKVRGELKHTLQICRKYKPAIDSYDKKVEKIIKHLYPFLFRLKKAIRRRVKRIRFFMSFVKEKR